MSETQETLNDDIAHLIKQCYELYFDNASLDAQFVMAQSQAIMEKYLQWWQTLNWQQLFEAQTNYMQSFFELCEDFQEQLKNANPVKFSEQDADHLKPSDIRFKPFRKFIEPPKSDRRFINEDWSQQPLYHFWMQQYLLFAKHVKNFLKTNKTKDTRLNKQVAFFTQLWLDALSPSNFHLTNPEVVAHIIQTQGESVVSGFKNFMLDMIQNRGGPYFKMTDMSAFEVGENIANTKGKVVFRNDMMELIQYKPTTKEIGAIPLLIVPPWINKYYILDLREKNSFVKWIVDQGFSVFMISWINPDKSYKNTTFSDYMQKGVIEAIEVVKKISQQPKVNTLGFCIGGTLLACTLGFLKARNDKSVHSSTFLTTLIDFSDTGDVEVFIDEAQINILNQLMEKEGVLDGKRLMLTFNLLRANDLFWSYYINNYLFGKQPFPFDLLYWNCDSVNLPYAMHKFYLENMYLKNALIKPNGITLEGVPINLSSVTVPCYFLSTEQDHIAPWETTFIGAQSLGGEVTFVLGGSGHIAGVVNPPNTQKYGYKTSDHNLSASVLADEWYQSAKLNEGSWWPHWASWLQRYSGETVKAKPPGSKQYPPLDDAPGRYVKKRLISEPEPESLSE